MAKHPGGRPTQYKKEYCLAVEFMSRTGLTDKQMAERFGVSEQTFNTWKQKHPEFLESIKGGKEEPDYAVERSLFQMATGYSYETEKALVVSDGKDNGAHVEKVSVRETIPPNPTSMIFWLKNRRPDRWRDRQEITGADGAPLNFSVSFVSAKDATDKDK